MQVLLCNTVGIVLFCRLFGAGLSMVLVWFVDRFILMLNSLAHGSGVSRLVYIAPYVILVYPSMCMLINAWMVVQYGLVYCSIPLWQLGEFAHGFYG